MQAGKERDEERFGGVVSLPASLSNIKTPSIATYITHMSLLHQFKLSQIPPWQITDAALLKGYLWIEYTAYPSAYSLWSDKWLFWRERGVDVNDDAEIDIESTKPLNVCVLSDLALNVFPLRFW